MSLDNKTRPTGEQLRFLSSKTGEHLLDTYLEAAERGNRPLYDLLSDLFDTTGKFAGDNFQFKIDPTTRKYQYRVGIYTSSTTGWLDVPNAYLFRQRGTYATGVAYEQLDIVTVSSNTYMCTTAHTSVTATPDLTKFAIMVDGSALSGAVSSAAASATAASSSASAAASSATSAASSATSSAASATLANDWATKTSSTVAGGEWSAKYHALAASSSASAAAGSATSASSSASAASAAKTAAESARDATLAAYDSFDDRYLGTKASDPTVDNDGNPLVAGALYFSSTAGSMRVYTGTAWVAAYVAGASGFVPLTGGSMTGPFYLYANATNNLEAVPLQQLNTALATKASTTHTHVATDITDSTAAGRNLLTAVDDAAQRMALGLGTAALSNSGDFATASHTHTITNVTGLQTALDGKQPLGSYAAAVHTHAMSDVTGLSTALAGKADTAHTHAMSDVTGLATALAAKFDAAGGVISGNVGINVSGSAVTKLDLNGGFAQNPVALSGSPTVDCLTGNYFTFTASGATTWTFPTSLPTSRVFVAIIKITNGGSGTQDFGSNVRWPGGTKPTLTSGASAIDVLGFITDDGGAIWRGVALMIDSKV